MYHGDSVWQLLFVIGIVFTNAKKFFFSHAREKRTKWVQLVFHHSAFKRRTPFWLAHSCRALLVSTYFAVQGN